MTADFILRPIDPDRDGPALHAVYGDPESCRYLTRPARETVADTIVLIRNSISPDGINLAIADAADAPALGRISVWPRGRNNVWDIACMIAPAARGRNLSVRALAIAIDDAFDRRGARRIVADIDPDNAASIRVFEKLGFTREAYLRGEWEMHIGIRDSVLYGLLRDDPRPWRNWPS